MDFKVILEQMVMLFSVVIAGYICGKTKLMDQTTSKKMSALIINLTCPCLIIASTMGDKLPERGLIIPLLIVSSVTYFILISIAAILPKYLGIKDKDQGIFSFMLAFGNVGFIGYPVVASMFGPEAVFYASVLNVANTFCVFIWGAQFIAGKEEGKFQWSRFYSPAMIGTYISIIIVAFAVKTPHVIAQPFTLIGNITVPGSLLIIGYSISQIPTRKMTGGPKIFIMAAFRLFILPVFIMYIFKFSGLVDEKITNINTMIIAMPVASFGTMFCFKYGRDETIMAQGTFITTLLSMLTIPIVSMLL
jgi:hypothetical protein